MVYGIDGSRSFLDKKTGTENYAYQLVANIAKIYKQSDENDIKDYIKVYLRPSNQRFFRETKHSWPSNFNFQLINYSRFWTQIGLGMQTFKDHLNVLFIPAHTLPLVRRPGLKTVITVHDLGAEYLPKTHQLKQRLYLKLMTDFQLKSATHIIAVSKATKNDLIKKIGIDSDRITVIYEGYNQSLLLKVKKDTIVSTVNHYDIEFKNYYLFVGTIQPRKNLERLILAFANYLKIASLGIKNNQKVPKLVLAGGKGWLSNQIYQLPSKLNINQFVKFLGYIPDSDLGALYQGAKAFVYPSLFEGFGLPILEAFACQCPVLTSNISSMPEIAGNAALLVDPYSVEAITSGFLNIDKKEVVERLINQGNKQLQKFSWDQAAKDTLRLLKAVGDGSKP